MIIKGKSLNAAIASPPQAWRAVLLYGPDEGLVRETATTIARSIVTDLSDPFRTVQLSGTQLRDDPTRLHDEAAAISMTGGRRVIRLYGITDSHAALFSGLLDNAIGDGLVVAEAGELAKTSKLRKRFEAADNAAIIACYSDTADGLEAVIETALRKEGLTLSPDARYYLLQNLGDDRLITRRELEKLMLYMASEKTGKIEIADARACIGDQGAQGLDEICDCMGLGDVARLDHALSRAFDSSMAPVAILRSAATHMMRLQLLVSAMAEGISLDSAMSGLRPPVHFSRAAAMRAQAQKWRVNQATRALRTLLEAEILCKTTGMPDVSICGQVLRETASLATPIRRH